MNTGSSNLIFKLRLGIFFLIQIFKRELSKEALIVLTRHHVCHEEGHLEVGEKHL